MKQVLFISILIFGLVSCKKDKDKVDFDRGAMLTSISSNSLLPAFSNMESKLIQLDNSVISFTTSSNQSSLTLLKENFIQAYKAYQKCKIYDFGPMNDYGISAAMNTYPTDTSKISTNITNGSYNLSSADNITAIGLPAIDFLLFSETESDIINKFTIHPNATNRKTYLSDLSEKMKNEIITVHEKWQEYQSTFNEADGNDIGGSTSILFNAFVKDIELLKNAKIGIPGGFQTSGQTLPNYTEGYFSGISIDLAVENITALQNLFNGGNSISFDDYIRDVESDEVEISLADNMNSQFETIKTNLQNIGNPLSEKVDSNPVGVSNAYNEIKKLVTYTKTDMSSILGLLITFQDNDGD